MVLGMAVAAVLPEITISLRHDEEGLQRMFLNGEDVTKEIRLPVMSMYASDVSAIPAVRDYLMELQRSLAREHSVIMDGRDIGTVVLPDADLKIFLTASAEQRAKLTACDKQQLRLTMAVVPNGFRCRTDALTKHSKLWYLLAHAIHTPISRKN